MAGLHARNLSGDGERALRRSSTTAINGARTLAKREMAGGMDDPELSMATVEAIGHTAVPHVDRGKLLSLHGSEVGSQVASHSRGNKTGASPPTYCLSIYALTTTALR